MKNVFLIASESKKEEWKRFFDKMTGIKIKWVEDTKNIESGYCLIAMKSFIEKREETFREIEEKYAEQLQNARQVFIFHLMTGTSHVDYLEKIQGKENWYYSVIDLDEGVPLDSLHNKKVIEDFNDKLLQELETVYEDDLIRKILLEIKTKDWNGKTVEYVLEKIKNECTRRASKPKLKMIVFGYIESGKSSLINAFMSAFSGKISNTATGGEMGDLKYSSCGVYFNHGPDLECYERRVTKKVKLDEENNILKTIMKKEYDSGHALNENTIYVILFLIDVKTLLEDGKQLEYLRQLRDKIHNIKCLKYLVITHMDTIYPDLKNNIKAIIDNDEMNEFTDEIYTKTNIPKEFILPVVTSVDTMMTDQYRTYFLYLLLNFVMVAEQSSEKKQKGTERKCIIL